jgi:hypothetical protein
MCRKCVLAAIERDASDGSAMVAAGATRVRSLYEEGLDHYAVSMLDPPKATSSTSTDPPPSPLVAVFSVSPGFEYRLGLLC